VDAFAVYGYADVIIETNPRSLENAGVSLIETNLKPPPEVGRIV
jgi:hypothetical protein